MEPRLCHALRNDLTLVYGAVELLRLDAALPVAARALLLDAHTGLERALDRLAAAG